MKSRNLLVSALGLTSSPLWAQESARPVADPDVTCFVATANTAQLAATRTDLPAGYANTARTIDRAANYYVGVITARLDDQQLATAFRSAVQAYAAASDRGSILEGCMTRFREGVTRIAAARRTVAE